MFCDMVILTRNCARAITWTGAIQALIRVINLVWSVWWAWNGENEENKRVEKGRRRGDVEGEGKEKDEEGPLNVV